MKPRELLFYLGPHRVLCYQLHQGGLQLLASFDGGPTQRQDCAAFLQAQSGRLVRFLVDCIEEDFQTGVVPRLGGRDRRVLLQRKLEQMYRTTPFQAVQRQGWVDETRREENLLFSALLNAQWIDQWLDLLEECGLVLSGIVSPALLSQAIFQCAHCHAGHLLLLSLNGESDLRQSYATSRQVRFSRLVALESSGLQDIASRVLGESLRTHHYLVSQRLLTRVDRLDVLIIVQAGQQTALAAVCKDQEVLQFTFIEPSAVLMAMGIKAQGGIDAQAMFATLALYLAPNHYAPRPKLLSFRNRRFGLRLQTGAACLSVLALCGFIGFSLAAVRLDQQRKQVQRQIAQVQSQLVKARARDHSVNSKEHFAVVTTYRHYLKGWPPVSSGLNWLAGVLDQHPSIRLNSLTWTFSPNNGDGGTIGAARARSSIAEEASSHHVVFALSGRLDPFGANYRQALLQLDQFRQHAMQGGKNRFEWQSLPLDTRPTATINSAGEPETGDFSARIVVPITVAGRGAGS